MLFNKVEKFLKFIANGLIGGLVGYMLFLTYVSSLIDVLLYVYLDSKYLYKYYSYETMEFLCKPLKNLYNYPILFILIVFMYLSIKLDILNRIFISKKNFIYFILGLGLLIILPLSIQLITHKSFYIFECNSVGFPS